MITKTHHFYLLIPSSWPLISSIGSFNLLFSILLFFKFNSVTNFLISILILTLCSFSWWSSYLSEFSFMGFSGFDLDNGIKMGMILFISSEVFFFFSFFWSYFHFFLSPGLESGFHWPPEGVMYFEALNVPFLNTLILLSSGILVTLSHYFLNLGEKMTSNFYLILTFLFGFIFTFFQFQEYQSSFFSIGDGSYGSSFFMLTGFHGIHVIIGSIFLMFSFLISWASISSSKLSFLSFELACWYWHFVDVVWIFLFFFLYYLND